MSITDTFAYLTDGLIASPDLPDVGNVTEDDTTNNVAGTYHESTEAQVESGVTFGADEGLTGTYDISSTPDITIEDTQVDLI